ncbi:hypothetical protein CDL15_Pgr000751 [Punica granatum]|uniref:ASCH domain-containing protein n=1 Tax=Punica granatum TaxID=22663 RepID=A0A218W442_PUNGR|nr:hypothetical protein CDL15_Pgr000751 [Punica granatum]
MKGRNHGNFTNPCLTMHQPWASLLVYGIKRIEGRSWPAPIRGRLWIHAASKVPDEATIKAMEEFYREIYAVDGVTDLKFPEHYPISRLIGCVDVVGCLRGEEVAAWDKIPEGVRLEAQTDFCWLCERPQRLIVPFEMRGYQRVYNLEKKIYDAAVRGLSAVESPFPVKFPLPDSRDPFSLKPGSLALHYPESKAMELDTSSSLSAAIAGARAAATQFSKKNQNTPSNQGISYSVGASQIANSSLEVVETTSSISDEISVSETSFLKGKEHMQPSLINQSSHDRQPFRTEQRPRPVVDSKVS